jgi:hypothetical protein
MTTYRLLDLFSGAGGAARGYQMAGFHVTGVDIKPQPRYAGDAFVQGDALDYVAAHGHEFDAIHASPPCQAFSVMKSLHNAKAHPNLIPETQALLRSFGVPYVIENVPGAPLETSLMLCGSMFGLRSHRGYLRRHRHFETSDLIFAPGPCRHEGLAIGVYGHGSAGHLGQRMRTANVDEARILMGMPWSTRDGLSQAIPPAYTKFIGDQLMAVLRELRLAS